MKSTSNAAHLRLLTFHLLRKLSFEPGKLDYRRNDLADASFQLASCDKGCLTQCSVIYIRASSLGYRPCSLSVWRSIMRSGWFSFRIRTVASPISVSARIIMPSNSKWLLHRSFRGSKSRTNPSLPGTTDAISVPLCKLQKTQENAKFSSVVIPPCFRLIMCSTWKRKKASLSANKQYSHTKFARTATKSRNFRSIALLIYEEATGTRLR